MKTKKSGRILSVLLSALMLMGLITPALSIPASAEGSDLIAEYFSTDSEWYDAVSGQNQLGWTTGSYTSCQSDGSHYFDETLYLRINTQNLFSGVSDSTGISFSYQWKADQSVNHRHIISLGANEFNGNSNANNHFYISATTSWMSEGKAPFVGYVNGSGDQLIGAYPADAPNFTIGEKYDITVVISAEIGVVFYINGAKYNAAYKNGDNSVSSFSAQQNNIKEFLNSVKNWNNNYIGVSRWADGYIKGYLKDLRIYKKNLSDEDVYTALASQYASEIANLDQSKLATPASFSFVPTVIDGNQVSSSWYQNVVYQNGMYFTGEYDKAYFNHKYVLPNSIVLVYDGQSGHTPSIPIEFETWVGSKHEDVIHAVTASTSYFALTDNWHGHMDGNGSNWTMWPSDYVTTNAWFSYQNNGNVGIDPSEAQNNNGNYQQDNTNTHRFWWNKLIFNGESGFDSTTYNLFSQSINLTFYGSYYDWYSRHYENLSVIHDINAYVINYAPIYNALNGPMWNMF
nr:hypothetical protein [Clostridia bacterium]